MADNIVVIEGDSEIGILVQPVDETAVEIVRGGTQGVPGANGNKIFTDTGAPSNTLGADGDFYVRTDTNNYYYKVAGVWILSGTLGSSLPNGGTTGQGLVKASNTDYDVQWANVVPVGPANTFAGFGSGGGLQEIPDWAWSNTTNGLIRNQTVAVDNAGYQSLDSLSFNFQPEQNSPNETWALKNTNVYFDQDSTGFDFGTNGEAFVYDSVYLGHQGTSDIGALVWHKSGGDIGVSGGPNPISVNGFAYSLGFMSFKSNVTLDGPLQGYIFQPGFEVGAVIDDYVVAFGDFATAPVATQGWTSANLSPTIGSIANNANYSGVNVNPNITTFNGNAGFTGVGVFATLGTLSTGFFQGVAISPTVTSCVNATGLNINMGSVTASGTKRAIDAIGDVSITGALSFSGALSIGQLSAFYATNPVDGGGNPQTLHGLTTSMTALASTTVANGDAIGVNTAMLITLQANSVTTSGPFQLGFAALALPCVIETHTGATLDYMSAAVYALNFSGSSTGGTIDTANIARCVPIPNGITTVNKLRGWYYHEPFGPIGTVRHGTYIEDAPAYFEEAVLIGGTPISDDTVTNASVALEIKSTTKAFVSSRMTTAERDAMTAIAGMVVFNTSTSKHQGYDGATWNDFY